MNTVVQAPAQPVQRRSFPIDFRLADEDGSPVLYLTDDPLEEHHLVLELTNSSGENILLDPNVGPHFELRFRQGTFSSRTLQLLKGGQQATVVSAEPGWSVEFQDGSPEYSLNFTCSEPANYFQPDPSGGALGLFAPGSMVTLALQNISADPAGGAQLSRVAFSPLHLSYSDQTAVTGFRQQALQVLSRQGKRQIPLHVGLVGPQTILNDGASDNTLRLRIINADKSQALTLNPRNGPAPTTLTLSFDTGDTQEDWALTSLDNASKINCSIAAGSNWHADSTGLTAEFAITTDNVSLGPGESLDILLENIVATPAYGQANLYIHYKNFPGFWSGQFVVPVQKTPLLFSGTNVGIGTQGPASPLSIESSTATSALSVNQKGTGTAASFLGRVEVGAAAAATAGQPAVLTATQISGSDVAHFTGRVSIISADPLSALTVQPSGTGMAANFLGGVNIGFQEQKEWKRPAWLMVLPFPGAPRPAAYFGGDVSVSGTLSASKTKLAPDYLSDWTQDNNSASHKTTFAHNLGYVPAFVMLYFSSALPSEDVHDFDEPGVPEAPTEQKIFLVGWTQNQAGAVNPVNVEVGLNQIVLHIKSGLPLYYEWDAATNNSTPRQTGFWRVALIGKQS